MSGQHIMLSSKMDEFELGYTPSNLRKLREIYHLTQAQVAQITETKNRNSVGYWELAPTAPNYSPMPHQKWLMLLNFIENVE